MKASKNLIILLAAAAILIMAWVIYLSQANQTPTQEAERELMEITKQSSSNETEAIETDLNETDFTQLDKDLLDIEAELTSTTEVETK